TEVSFGDKTLKCKSLENFDFDGMDICLMSAGGAVSKEWAPKIAAQGCVVIDNSSAWRYDANVPLIVPEVNADAIRGFSKRNIIANPNCSKAQLVVALKPLHDKATIRRVIVATYQSAPDRCLEDFRIVAIVIAELELGDVKWHEPSSKLPITVDGL